jgi:hypothetical protein
MPGTCLGFARDPLGTYPRPDQDSPGRLGPARDLTGTCRLYRDLTKTYPRQPLGGSWTAPDQVPVKSQAGHSQVPGKSSSSIGQVSVGSPSESHASLGRVPCRSWSSPRRVPIKSRAGHSQVPSRFRSSSRRVLVKSQAGPRRVQVKTWVGPNQVPSKSRSSPM